MSDSSKRQLDYLLKKSFISHEGVDHSQVEARAVQEGATALIFGEIIGYSPILDELFNSWKHSSAHNSILLDPKWNWVGLSVKKVKNLYVAVINFSTGIIGSTQVFEMDDGRIQLKGRYIHSPKFTGDYEILDFKIKHGYFMLYIKSVRKNFFIYVHDGNGRLSDRVDIFF